MTWLAAAREVLVRIIAFTIPLFRVIGKVLGARLTLRTWHLLTIIALVVGWVIGVGANQSDRQTATVEVQDSKASETDSFQVVIDDYYHDIDSAEVARQAAIERLEHVRADSLQHLLDSLYATPSPRQRNATQTGRGGPHRKPG